MKNLSAIAAFILLAVTTSACTSDEPADALSSCEWIAEARTQVDLLKVTAQYIQEHMSDLSASEPFPALARAQWVTQAYNYTSSDLKALARDAYCDQATGFSSLDAKFCSPYKSAPSQAPWTYNSGTEVIDLTPRLAHGIVLGLSRIFGNVAQVDLTSERIESQCTPGPTPSGHDKCASKSDVTISEHSDGYEQATRLSDDLRTVVLLFADIYRADNQIPVHQVFDIDRFSKLIAEIDADLSTLQTNAKLGCAQE